MTRLRTYAKQAGPGVLACLVVGALLMTLGWGLYLNGLINADMHVLILNFSFGVGLSPVWWAPLYVAARFLTDTANGGRR